MARQFHHVRCRCFLCRLHDDPSSLEDEPNLCKVRASTPRYRALSGQEGVQPSASRRARTIQRLHPFLDVWRSGACPIRDDERLSSETGALQWTSRQGVGGLGGCQVERSIMRNQQMDNQWMRGPAINCGRNDAREIRWCLVGYNTLQMR